MPHDSVVHPLSGLLVVPLEPVPFTARIEYRRDDPFAVRLHFGPEHTLDGAPIVWTFARRLLADGLSLPVGDGDVGVRPHGAARTAVELRTPDGYALLVLRTRELEAFLDASERVVPTGSEGRLIAWDDELAALVRGAC
ncbi:SsgA family sporulation/cell division regulator [Kitasatospora sp. NPDC096147]|uniref:SsgA family sporulation/cell division regulator n=1 Tax=Kitasatospora sp. NPDC096147 TaxID=3364093 RepID=UPI0037F6F473